MRHTQACGAGRRWTVAAGLAGALVLASTPLFAQELTLHGTTTTRGQQTATTEYISPGGTRNSMGDGREIILRLDQKKIYIINTKQKTYNEMSFDDLQKMTATATAGMDNLPPEAAAQMKKMMGGMGGGDVTVTPLGTGETIAGYATEKYHIAMGSMMEIDLSAAPALVMPPMYYDAMKAAMPANPMMDMKKLFEEYKKIKGTPLKSVTTVKMMGQTMTTEMIVTSVDRSPIPAGTFDVPAGYKLVPMGK